jgi:hypothetical protein
MNKKEVWFKGLGFHNNPFSIKPAAFHDRVFGYDKAIDDISYGILNKKLIIVQGKYGSGKSSILKRLINDFGGKKQVIYYSCNRIDQRLNIKALLNGRYGTLGKFFNLKPKNMILFLDEAQDLGEKDFQKLYSYYQEGFFKAIVLVGQGIEKSNIPSEFNSKIEEVSIGTIEVNTAVKVIRKRIGSLELLSDEFIKELFMKSNSNIRMLLKNCEEACRIAIERGKRSVDSEVLRFLFSGKTSSPVAEKKKVVEEKSSKAEKVPEKKAPAKAEKVPEKKAPAKEEKASEKKAPVKEEKVPEKKVIKKVVKKGAKKDTKSKRIYNPDNYKNMINKSSEELLNKGTDEIFADDQYN